MSTKLTFTAGRKVCPCQFCSMFDDIRNNSNDNAYQPAYTPNVTPKENPKFQPSTLIQAVSKSKETKTKSDSQPALNKQETFKTNVKQETKSNVPKSTDNSVPVTKPEVGPESENERSDEMNTEQNKARADTENVAETTKFFIIKEDFVTSQDNTRPLNKDATTYELQNFKKNLLIILNHDTIIQYKECRTGAENDFNALNRTFSQFGFEIEMYTEVSTVLNSFNHRDFSEYGCVAIVVLTRVAKGGYLSARGEIYDETDLLKAFTAYKSLVTKPKLLIIQACRGTESGDGGTSTTSFKKHDIWFIPTVLDVYILCSSYEENISNRDKIEDNRLIQILCKKINELAATQDFVSIVEEVKNEMLNLNFKDTQMPREMSTLIRDLYFRKYGECMSANPDVKSEKCTYSVEYCAYIKTCLRLHLQDNPHDAVAVFFVEASEKCEESSDMKAKEKTMTAIVKYLSKLGKIRKP